MSKTRRGQIRRAQKMYRQRKEAIVQKAQTLVTELEHRIGKLGDLLQAYKVTLQSTLKDTYPRLIHELDGILSFLSAPPAEVMGASNCDGLSSREISETSVPRPSADPMGGDQVITQKSPTSHASLPSNIGCSREAGHNHPAAPTATHNHVNLHQPVCQTIRAHAPHSYSYLESSFTRRLKRSSLEHAFRVFTDPHSNPLEVFRIFRLVPCFRDRVKMYPYFEKLVTSSLGDSLEISALPFYSVGGAGTHYPALDEAGKPIYPPGAKIPRRILGILPMSGAYEDPPFVDHSQSQRHLELCGFGGEWFDCRDVEGYLRARGVDLDGSGVIPVVAEFDCGSLDDVHGSSAHQNEYLECAGSTSVDGPVISQTRLDISASQLPHCILDLESFITGLLRGMAILGRAPGFRRTNVEDAFQSALLR
ncbi:hypothetical protein ASPCADRAFT_125349 [Aspergillus carbonarius ITEM 5010]|uniref:BZIP domain-containing protein n=1 Tax=Aspergillus carbonarius (strain ITEM 5010) TaxID=602072 RepID=A0A1R3S0S2_ASPC5|nr:hypothetical protein ASPCADRAFT_125349 [Aspergillus carbonarius ITEM 5010]